MMNHLQMNILNIGLVLNANQDIKVLLNMLIIFLKQTINSLYRINSVTQIHQLGYYYGKKNFEKNAHRKHLQISS